MARRRTEITLREALQLFRVGSRNTLFGWAEEGWITMRKKGDRWMVPTVGLRAAKVLTVGKVAKMVGCSERTVRDRIRNGVVRAFRPRKSVERMAGDRALRLSLQDVATIRASMQRRRRRTAKPAGGAAGRRPARPVAPERYVDPDGMYWLAWRGRWWREGPRPPRLRAC